MTPEQAFDIADRFGVVGQRSNLALAIIDAACPKLVTEETGTVVTVQVGFLRLGVVGNVIGQDLPATRDCPEERRVVEVEAIYLAGYRLPDEIANSLADWPEVREAIDEAFLGDG